MSNDYAKGFKDGFAAGLEEGKKISSLKYPNYLGSPGTCQVCGKYWGNGVWGYVCSNQYCPSRAIAYTTGAALTGAVGAVGSVSKAQSFSAGANGPTMNDSYELGN